MGWHRALLLLHIRILLSTTTTTSHLLLLGRSHWTGWGNSRLCRGCGNRGHTITWRGRSNGVSSLGNGTRVDHKYCNQNMNLMCGWVAIILHGIAQLTCISIEIDSPSFGQWGRCATKRLLRLMWGLLLLLRRSRRTAMGSLNHGWNGTLG